jgi:hypothetical protein
MLLRAPIGVVFPQASAVGRDYGADARPRVA